MLQRSNQLARRLRSSLGWSSLCLATATLGCARPPATSPATTTPPPAVATVSATLVLDGVNVVVLEPTPHIDTDRSIIADGERIVWVGPRAQRPAVGEATVVDGAGQFVIPGLSDMHVHLPTQDDAPFPLQTFLELQLAAGVTSIRSMRGDPAHAALRSEIADGTRVGPDLHLASVPVATESLSTHDAQRVVQAAERDGADFIKLLGVGDTQSYRNLMGAAQTAGLSVAGHLPQNVPAETAIELGQQSIEHLGGILDVVRSDLAAAPAAAALLAQPSVYHCPTLQWYALGLGVYAPADFTDAPGLASVSAETRAQWDATLAERRATLGETTAGRTLGPIEDRLAALKLLHDAGAVLLVGPDSAGAYGLPGSAVHDEMRLFADAGIPAAEVLRAATSNAAALRGAADEGAVKVGYIANLAVLAGDPLQDIANVSTVRLTVHRGRIVEPRVGATAPQPRPAR